MDAGAHYYKTDLQVHTPRDRRWTGKRPTTDDERRAFGRTFVDACRARGLQAVAITDHHDLTMVDFIRTAAREEQGQEGEPLPPELRLVVFPGLELTLAVPCQALLILDADFPSDRLPSVLERLGVDASDPKLPEHDEPTQIPGIDSLPALHARLDQADWLRRRYAVLPNVSDGGDHTLIRKKLQQRYIEMPCVGGYVDGPASKLGDGNKQILSGKAREWGNKRIAVIQTSDSRTEGFTCLGAHSTWIKWATPTAEAIRQACLAQESRISLVEPTLPRLLVTRLSVSNSKFLGRVNLELSPQYSAFIGGRGTGKSSCLEYLRWALCDQPPDLSTDDDDTSLAARRQRLISNTLAPFDATVEVHFIVNGVQHVVRRWASDQRVMLKVGDETFAPATPENVRSLLRIEAYSQRQLSTIGVRLDELTRFVEAPIRSELLELSTRRDQLAAAIRQNYGVVERHRALAAEVDRDAFTITSVRQQATRLRTELVDLSPDDAECLNAKPAYDRERQLTNDWLRKLDQASSAIEQARDSVARVSSSISMPASDTPNRDALAALETATRSVMEDAQGSMQRILETVRAQRKKGQPIEEHLAVLRDSHDAYRARYEGARQRATEHASRLEELEQMDERLGSLESSLQARQEELATLGQPIARHRELLEEWREIQKQRTKLLEAQCDHLSKLSGTLILATVERGVGTAKLYDRLRGATTGANVRGTRLEALISRVSSASDPLLEWHATIAELEERVVAGPERLADIPAPTTSLGVLTPTDLERIVGRLVPADVMELALVPLEDHPTFKYRTKESEFIAFEDASAGQQATALLEVLLNEDGPPLLIDQPEDDLDSQVISQIVDKIWAAKHRRQLIFSSHNANLVVNGDAELVVCCDYAVAGDHSAGTVKLKGAIDIPQVREEITLVMEGGERAFRLRKDKYGF
jgi:chromosome segregation protein